MSDPDPELPERIERTLRDLLRFTDMATRLVRRGKAAYDTDEVLRLASEAILHKIGEAAGRLPEDFRNGHPQVAWRSMRATRSVIAQDDNQVDYDLIWNAFVRRLPAEADKIRRILGTDGSAGGQHGQPDADGVLDESQASLARLAGIACKPDSDRGCSAAQSCLTTSTRPTILRSPLADPTQPVTP